MSLVIKPISEMETTVYERDRVNKRLNNGVRLVGVRNYVLGLTTQILRTRTGSYPCHLRITEERRS